MRVLSSPKVRSLLSVVACAGGLSLACAAVGCDGDGWGHHHHDMTGVPATPPDETLTTTPDKVAIDTGATITATPGTGVGVFVEYATGGHWTITTACDTNTSGVSCDFDLFIAGVDPSTKLTNPSGKDLAGLDEVSIQGDGTLHLYTNTSTALDGITFDAPAGAAIQLEMYLDAQPQPRFVYWIGDKVLHTGAPTDPIDLTPSAE
jgi:hypothetical protein